MGTQSIVARLLAAAWQHKQTDRYMLQLRLGVELHEKPYRPAFDGSYNVSEEMLQRATGLIQELGSLAGVHAETGDCRAAAERLATDDNLRRKCILHFHLGDGDLNDIVAAVDAHQEEEAK